MRVVGTPLPEVLIIEPNQYHDERGFFAELYQQTLYLSLGIPVEFVQDNLSFSKQGVLRGMHCQNPHSQAKLMQVLQGEVWDVAVDIRKSSAQFGCWTAVRLSSAIPRQLFIPPGFAHGFCVLSETALFYYKCSAIYAPQAEVGFCWNDPDVGIEWPIQQPILSGKDAALPLLRNISMELLPA